MEPMTLEDARTVLGLGQGATFEQAVGAKNKMLQQAGEDLDAKMKVRKRNGPSRAEETRTIPTEKQLTMQKHVKPRDVDKTVDHANRNVCTRTSPAHPPAMRASWMRTPPRGIRECRWKRRTTCC